MKLTFRPTPPLGEYHGNGLNLKPGETAEVVDALGTGLLRDFPLNFVRSQDIIVPPVDRQIKKPLGRKRA